MSLSGNLRTMSLPDILQWIAQGQKTGTLHLEQRAIRKRIAFKQGKIFTSSSNDPRESLGQFLVSQRYVSEEQLFRALLAQEKEGRLIGSILVDSGILSETDLARSLHQKACETIYDLFLWAEGSFDFKDAELPDNVHFHLDLAVQGVILEGIRRVDEWGRIKRVFPSTRTTFEVKGSQSAVQDPLDRQALALAALGKTLAEIALELHRTDFETAALFFDLDARELVGVKEAPGDISTDPVDSIATLLKQAESHVLGKHYEQALKSYEEVLALDRLNQHAKKGLLAVSEARGRDRAL